MRYYIVERCNPQFKKPYYILLGKVKAEVARKRENTLYGTNCIMSYPNEAEYNAKIAELIRGGFSIHT